MKLFTSILASLFLIVISSLSYGQTGNINGTVTDEDQKILKEFYSRKYDKFPNSDFIHRYGLYLPSGMNLKIKEITSFGHKHFFGFDNYHASDNILFISIIKEPIDSFDNASILASLHK